MTPAPGASEHYDSLDAIDGGVLVFDAAGNVVAFNTVATTRLLLTPDQLRGHSCWNNLSVGLRAAERASFYGSTWIVRVSIACAREPASGGYGCELTRETSRRTGGHDRAAGDREHQPHRFEDSFAASTMASAPRQASCQLPRKRRRVMRCRAFALVRPASPRASATLRTLTVVQPRFTFSATHAAQHSRVVVGAPPPTISSPASTHVEPGAPKPAGPRLRKQQPPWPLLVLVAVISFGVLGWVGSQVWTAAQPAPPLSASGTLEADEVTISSEVPGRIAQLSITEGETVRAGSEVARLDSSVAQTQLQQAVGQADALQLAQLTAQKYVILAPLSGIITQVPIHQGEVVNPGQMIGAIADLSTLKLTVWVLERDVGKVNVGQVVAITADPFPGREFSGLVTSINTQAEFTPRNVQTEADRLNLVFGVNISVDNVEALLKPGMPVDAHFPTTG